MMPSTHASWGSGAHTDVPSRTRSAVFAFIPPVVICVCFALLYKVAGTGRRERTGRARRVCGGERERDHVGDDAWMKRRDERCGRRGSRGSGRGGGPDVVAAFRVVRLRRACVPGWRLLRSVVDRGGLGSSAMRCPVALSLASARHRNCTLQRRLRHDPRHCGVHCQGARQCSSSARVM